MPEPKKFELTPSISILIAGFVIAASIVFVNHYPAAQPVAAAGAAAPATAGANVPAPSANDHIVGSPTAPIVLVEYSDFQCPYCSMIYPSLKDIVAKSNGQIAWVYREFPLYQIHPNALPAANAAECINDQLGNTAFWKFVDDDFNNQSNIGTAFFSAEAQKLGADMTKYNACVAVSTFQNKIEGQIAEAENSGGNGTPYTVIINTQTGKQFPVSGALPEAQLMAAITAAQK
jgi:protein-disulfide isomerase